MLDAGHYKTDDYSQRMTYEEWAEILLSGMDQIIYKGRMVPLMADDLGYGVVEVTKLLDDCCGIALIAEERIRQITVKGFGQDHDECHLTDELAQAAASYILQDPEHWPFELKFWKPTPDDRLRELVKAGALIAAEIDRELHRRSCS
jgi:hypothetical protein